MDQDVLEVMFLLPVRQMRLLERRARTDGLTVAQVLRRLIRDYLEEDGCGTGTREGGERP